MHYISLGVPFITPPPPLMMPDGGLSGGIVCSFRERTFLPTGNSACTCTAVNQDCENAKFSKWIPDAYTLKDNGIGLFPIPNEHTIIPRNDEPEQCLSNAFCNFEALMNTDFHQFQWGPHSVSPYNVRRQPFVYLHKDPWKWKDTTHVVNEWVPIQNSKTLVVLHHTQQDHWNWTPSERDDNMISLQDLETCLRDEHYELMAVPPGHGVRFISNQMYHAAVDLPDSAAPSCSYELRVSGTPRTIERSLSSSSSSSSS